MRIASEVETQFEISDAYAVMGTEANKQLLEDASLLNEDAYLDVAPDDLILVVAGPDDTATKQALETMREQLATDAGQSEGGGQHDTTVRTIESATDSVDTPEIALISVPREYAQREAWKALQEGLHVHLFSDGIDQTTELELKEYALAQDLLCMGPDCGSAIVDGVPLGFANEVREGSIGVVSASGTGLQEVTCLLHRAGLGISQAIGTGGRDLSDTVGGLATCDALDRLDDDPATEAIVVISKPPSETAKQVVAEAVQDCSKPVVIHFQGASEDEIVSGAPIMAETLTHAAKAVAEASGTIPPNSVLSTEQQENKLLDSNIPDSLESLAVRGLFCGGTLCTEAALILQDHLPSLRTNVGVATDREEAASHDSHELIDLGADEFTQGRPHPMIDSTLRDEQFRAALADDAVGIILLDIVLGYGVEQNPVAGIVEALGSNDDEGTLVVASVCGTDNDLQVRNRQVQRLEDAGVIVASSNAAAARTVVTALDQTHQGGVKQ